MFSSFTVYCCTSLSNTKIADIMVTFLDVRLQLFYSRACLLSAQLSDYVQTFPEFNLLSSVAITGHLL